MANVGIYYSISWSFLNFMPCFPLQDSEFSKYYAASFNAMDKDPLPWFSKLKKRCFQLPLQKECGTIEKYFSTAMMWNFQYPCFHRISAVQLTASRVKATVARGSLQPIAGGSRDLSPDGFSSIPHERQRAYQDHSTQLTFHLHLTLTVILINLTVTPV